MNDTMNKAIINATKELERYMGISYNLYKRIRYYLCYTSWFTFIIRK